MSPTNGTQQHAEPEIVCQRIGYELSEHWPWVRQALLKIKKKDHETGLWTPEQVRQWLVNAIVQNHPFPCLLIVFINKEPGAYCILTAPPDPYTLVATTLYGFAAYSDPKRVRDRETRDKVRTLMMTRIIQLAREHGIVELEGHTIRAGWARYAAEWGFRLARVVYRKRLVEDGL